MIRTFVKNFGRMFTENNNGPKQEIFVCYHCRRTKRIHIRLTNKEKKSIILLRQEGIAVDEIAKKLNRSHATIYGFLKRHTIVDQKGSK